MASPAFPVYYFPAMLCLPIMAAETVTECPRAKIGAFRMSRIPRLAVGRDMSSWNDNGIPLDGFIMHDAGMTSRTTFSSPTNLKGLHVLAMAHDQPHLVHWWRKVPWRRLRHTKDMTMATETDSGVHTGLEIVRVDRRSKYVDGRISDSCQDLIG